MNNANKIYITCFVTKEILRVDAITGYVEARIPAKEFPYSLFVDKEKVISTSFWDNTPPFGIISDADPNQFFLSDPVSVPTNSETFTNSVVISGINSQTFASVPALYSATIIKNGVESGNKVPVVDGDILIVKFTTPDEEEKVIELPLFVGSKYDWFKSKTLPKDRLVDAFYFDDVIGSELNQEYVSNEITISGLSNGVSVTLTASFGSIILNGVSTSVSSIIVKNDDKVRILATTDNTYEARKFITVTCGSYLNIWTLFNKAQTAPTDYINPIIIQDVVLAQLDTLYQSEEKTITGLTQNPIRLYLEPYASASIIKNGVDVGQYADFVVGDKFRIKAKSPLDGESYSTIGLYSHNFSTTFTIRTTADIYPDLFAFQDIIDVIPRSKITSVDIYTISGTKPNQTFQVIIAPNDIAKHSTIAPTLIINGVETSSNIATVKLGDTIRYSAVMNGVTWNGYKVTLSLKTQNGFQFATADVYTKYLSGVAIDDVIDTQSIDNSYGIESQLVYEHQETTDYDFTIYTPEILFGRKTSFTSEYEKTTQLKTLEKLIVIEKGAGVATTLGDNPLSFEYKTTIASEIIDSYYEKSNSYSIADFSINGEKATYQQNTCSVEYSKNTLQLLENNSEYAYTQSNGIASQISTNHVVNVSNDISVQSNYVLHNFEVSDIQLAFTYLSYLSESYGKQTISSEYERAYKQFSQIASDYYRYDAISIPIDSNYVVNVINGYDIDVQYARYSQNITAINSLYASEVKYKGIHSSVFYELHVSSNNLGALLYIQSSSENIFAVSIDYLINKSSVLSIEQNLPELNVLSGIEVLSNYVVSSRNAVELAIVAQYDVNVVETIESDNLSVEDRRLFATAQDAIDAGIAAGYVNAKAYQLQDGVYFWYVETEDDAFCKLDIDVIRAVPVSWYVQGG